MVSWNTPIKNFNISLPKKTNSVPRYGLIFILSINDTVSCMQLTLSLKMAYLKTVFHF